MRFNFLTNNNTTNNDAVKLSSSYPIYFASFLGRSYIDEYIMSMIHNKSKMRKLKKQNIVECIYVNINNNFRPYYTGNCFDKDFDLKPLSDNVKENLVMNYVLSNYLFLDDLGFGDYLKALNKDTYSIVRYSMNGETIDEYVDGCDISISSRFISKDFKPEKNKNYISLKEVTREIVYICEISNKNEKDALLGTSLSNMGFFTANFKSMKEYLSDIPEPEKLKLFSDRVYATCYIPLCHEMFPFYTHDVDTVYKHWTKIFSIFQFKGHGLNKNQSILFSDKTSNIVTNIKFELKNNTTNKPGGVEEDPNISYSNSDEENIDIEYYKLTVFELRKLQEILEILSSDRNPTSLCVKDVDYYIKEIALSKIDKVLNPEKENTKFSPIDSDRFFKDESLSVIGNIFPRFIKKKSSKYYFPSGMFFLDELLLKCPMSCPPLLENKNKNADRDILNVWLTLNWLHPLIVKLGHLIYLEKISITNFTVKDILENVRIPAYSNDGKRYTLTETLEFANTVKSIYNMDYKSGSMYREDIQALKSVNGKCNMNATDEHLYLESIKNAPRSSNSSVYSKSKMVVDCTGSLFNANLYVESETDLSLFNELEDDIHLPSALHVHGFDRAGGNRMNVPELSKLNTNSMIDYNYDLIGNKSKLQMEKELYRSDVPLDKYCPGISSRIIPNVTYTANKLNFIAKEIESRKIQNTALLKLLGGVNYEPEYLKTNFISIYRVMLEKLWINLLGNTQYCMLKTQGKPLNDYFSLLIKCYLDVVENGFMSNGMLDELIISGRNIAPGKTDEEMLGIYKTKSNYLYNERFSYREIESAKRKLKAVYKSRIQQVEGLADFIDAITHRVNDYNYYSDAYKNKMPGFKNDVYNFYVSSFRKKASDHSDEINRAFKASQIKEELTPEELEVLDIDGEDSYRLNLRNIEDRLLYVNDISESNKNSGTYSKKSRTYIPFYNPKDTQYYGDATDKYLSNKIENVLDNNYRFLGIGDIPFDFYNLKLGTELIAENLFSVYVERERMLLDLYVRFITNIYTSPYSERIDIDGLSKLSMQAIKGLDRSSIGREQKYFNKVFVAEKKQFISSYKEIAGVIAHLDLNKFIDSTDAYEIIKDYELGSSEIYFINGLKDNRESILKFPEYLLEKVLKQSVFYLGRCALKTRKDDNCSFVFQRIFSEMKSGSTMHISGEALNKLIKEDFLKAKDIVDDIMVRARLTLKSLTDVVRRMLPNMNTDSNEESTINPNGYSPVLESIWTRAKSLNFKDLGTVTKDISDANHKLKSLVKSYVRSSSIDKDKDYFTEMLHVNGSPLIFACNCHCLVSNNKEAKSFYRDDSEFIKNCKEINSFTNSKAFLTEDFIKYFDENDITVSKSFITDQFFCCLRFREGTVPTIVPLCPKDKDVKPDLKTATLIIPEYFNMDSDDIVLSILKKSGELVKSIESGHFNI